VGRQLVAETQLLCVQVSDEPESLNELSGASSTGATPFLGDVLSEEVKCNRPVATQQAGSRSLGQSASDLHNTLRAGDSHKVVLNSIGTESCVVEKDPAMLI